ncbi:hypothetical protein MPTK1_2g08060 [Marchantia polymorpha subsp. ruderalis]|uniref:PGG domain-containing protein n=1 Tax=Marchantia polymorpha TaxID=3197 RepID=A0A2R6XGU9_MARPO|nr:hypothetical protein MARPO_0015s0093 [Marchantia polymorpha]BBN01520.1 hypothetical protein Mp_2g08060 [Marchantia polymorpha subsp. ruderalis]|eukprot:PTQ45289.1 hypothetical protein MARPO_0015s0093 [Marchantia polymorpha]
MNHPKLSSMNLQEAVADLDLHSFISKVPHIPVIDVKNWDREGSQWRSTFSALSTGDWLKVNRLLKQAESDLLDEPRDGELQCAILLGSYFGHIDLVRRIITSVRDVLRLAVIETAKTDEGFTALHLASMGVFPDPLPEGLAPQHAKVVKLLLESSNCNTELLTAKTATGEWTALHLAAGKGQIDSLRALLAGYQSAGPAGMGGREELAYVLRDANGMTPLHLAALESHEEVVRELLQCEMMDVNALNNLALTPLHLASIRGMAKIVEELVRVPRVDVNAVDCCLSTALHWAAHSGATDVVRCFIDASKHRTVRMTEEDLDGSTALQITAEDMVNQEDIHKMLLELHEVKVHVDRLYRDRQVFVDAANAMLVGAALISSVTFGGWLQPPLGYVRYSQFSADYAAVEQHLSVRLFWIFNSFAFYLAMATVISGAGCVLPMNTFHIKRAVRRIRYMLNFTSFLLGLSILFVLAAFTAAGFACLPPIQEQQARMRLTTLIGLIVCACVLVYMTKVTSFNVRFDLKIAQQYLTKKLILFKERISHRLAKDAQSQEHQIFVKMAELANISDLDKREQQKDEVIDRLQLYLYLRDLPTLWYRTRAEKAVVDALMAFRNAGVLEVDGSSGQLRRRLHSYRVQDLDSLYWSFKVDEHRRFNGYRRRRNPLILYDLRGKTTTTKGSNSIRDSFKNR